MMMQNNSQIYRMQNNLQNSNREFLKTQKVKYLGYNIYFLMFRNYPKFFRLNACSYLQTCVHTCVRAIMQSTENFSEYAVVQLKEYLKRKGITTSNPSKEQLLTLCRAAKTLESDSNLEECNTSKIIEEKLIKIGLTCDPTSLNHTSNMH